MKLRYLAMYKNKYCYYQKTLLFIFFTEKNFKGQLDTFKL